MVNDRFGWKTKKKIDLDLGIYEKRFASVTLEKQQYESTSAPLSHLVVLLIGLSLVRAGLTRPRSHATVVSLQDGCEYRCLNFMRNLCSEIIHLLFFTKNYRNV